MKTILGLCLTIVLAGGFLLWQNSRKPEQMGVFTGAPKVEAAALIERPEAYLSQTVLVEGEVRYQCKAAGCFFFFTAGSRQLRVDLEQVAATLPIREGRMARVEGQLVKYGDGYQLLGSGVEFL